MAKNDRKKPEISATKFFMNQEFKFENNGWYYKNGNSLFEFIKSKINENYNNIMTKYNREKTFKGFFPNYTMYKEAMDNRFNYLLTNLESANSHWVEGVFQSWINMLITDMSNFIYFHVQEHEKIVNKDDPKGYIKSEKTANEEVEKFYKSIIVY